MKSRLAFLLIFLASMAQIVPATADIQLDSEERDSLFDTRFDEELSERDWDAMIDYINTKRTINLHEKSYNLTIAGDVRFNFDRRSEKRLGKQIRVREKEKECKDGEKDYGSVYTPKIDENNDDYETYEKKKYTGKTGSKRKAPNKFKARLNLYLDYVCENAWGVAQLQFDNPAGIVGTDRKRCKDPEGCFGSGVGCDINLKKAYMGYNFFCCGDARLDVELGRRSLYQVFDSKVQYLTRFDGIVAKYYDSCDLFDWYTHVGIPIVDYRSDHYAWVAEVGYLDICCTGIDFKYSFIDWSKNGKNITGHHDPKGYQFLNSQFTLHYNFDPEILCVPIHLYAALVWNHDAGKGFRVAKDPRHPPMREKGMMDPEWKEVWKKGTRKINERKNLAWYAGFTMGEIYCAGDLAAELRYEYVQARSIPECDVSGIGRGNLNGESFTELFQRRGNTNYQGAIFEVLYAFTDNLTFDASFEYSREIDRKIGGKQRYSKFYIEAIYAF